MKNLEWPGIATAAMIILILVIAFDLSKWQPLAAALIALGGGFLAYRGAMEKVEVDREEHKREFVRRQLAQCLKLELAITRFQPGVRATEAVMIFRSSQEEPIAVGRLRIKEPVEITEAWENLDVFPRRLIREIASIRTNIREIDDLLEGLSDDTLLRSGGEHPTNYDLVLEKISAVGEACAIIRDGLTPEIDRLAPPLSDYDRVTALYGEPGPEDEMDDEIFRDHGPTR